METERALAAFAALGQDKRLEIVRLLVTAGEPGLAAGEIAARTGARPNTLSANLAVLSRAGLVVGRREGRHVVYAADMAAIRGLVEFLLADCCGGNLSACAPILDQIAC